MRVRLPQELLEGVRSHVDLLPGTIACGLLLGRRDDGELVVVRSLRCQNAAAPERRDSAFAIEPAVIRNVRASLVGRALSIVGFYYGLGSDSGEPTARDLELLLRWPGSLLLIVPGVKENRCRGWWWPRHSNLPCSADPEILPPRVSRLVACPE